MKKENVIILEDHPDSSNYLKFITSLILPNQNIVAVETLGEALYWLEGNDPRLALIDIGLPDGSGLDFLKALKQKNPQTTSVIVTILGDDETLFTALSLGADGYILKDEDQNVIHRTLQKIELGEPPLSASIALRLIKYFHQDPKDDTERRLSPREIETLKLIASGMTVPEAASKLGLSRQTIAGYVKNIYQKLQVSSRAEATREALRMKII